MADTTSDPNTDPLSDADLLPVDATELVAQDIRHAGAIPREFRITVSPIASFFFEIYRAGNPPAGPDAYRRVQMRSNSLKADPPASFEAFRCETVDPFYYVGRAVAEFRPLGATKGSFIFAGSADGLVSGDAIGFRYTRDEVVGGTFRVEVFRETWDTILLESMTNAFKRLPLSF